MQPTLRERISRELLPRVRQPAQYIGGELNQLVGDGDWQRAEVRLAIGFPDAYTIGMSHLGCQILYWMCNHTPGVCAERTFAPWVDAERVMREQGIPLFTWDTRQPVGSADIFAISLQYELCFTTVLNMLDLAGIPIRHTQRMAGRTANGHQRGLDGSDDYPLIIVGGPQADNPEPMADFVDLVVLGDGEHSLAAIVEAVREYKRAGVGRAEMILRIARRFPWVYAPNLYRPRYHADGTLAALEPLASGLPERIERCKTPDFEAVPFPTRPLVPYSEVVHDRIGIEIMRGCPQVCRFCHAGYTKRPLNLRSVDRILEIAEQAYRATGHHEIGLLSLSTADYPHLRELAKRLNERFAPRHVNLSFPSLRVDRMLMNIPWMANSVRKGGITMAIEAARDDLRAAIRKKVTDGKLLDGVREVYRAGWQRIKLYFMAGFPGEREEDIRGIFELAEAVSLERCKLGLRPGQVTASVGWLVPKPFTPFQWMAQPRVDYFRHVCNTLRHIACHAGRGVKAIVEGQAGFGSAAEWASENELKGTKGGAGVSPADRNPKGRAGVSPANRDSKGGAGVSPAKQGRAGVSPADRGRDREVAASRRTPSPLPRKTRARVTIRMHDAERSILEGVFARGDRRLGAVIEHAWRLGARFDGWDECYDDTIWQRAYAATGIDPAWYAHRERSFDELLPWDHIGLHMRRGYLEESYDDVYARIGVPKPLPGIQDRIAPLPRGTTRQPTAQGLPVVG